MDHRNVNLDRLRATALALVVVFHVAQMWPTPLPGLTRYTALGAYGVDLFFVLSGWLIGGLFWRELARSGTVRLPRFVARRVLRTVPCYLVALLLAWSAVRVADPARGQFDWAYLLFLQNYEETMPYFLVSWSLCIEEHFYLLMPIAMLALSRIGKGWLLRLWPVCLLPLVFRLATAPADVGGFGRAWTATHFRFEGLLAGVLAAWVAQNDAERWEGAVRWSRRMVLPMLALGGGLYYGSRRQFYVVGLAALAFGFLFLLVALVGHRTRVGAGHRVVKAVAVGSYSAYLTHALMIHVARWTIARFSIGSVPAQFAIFAAIIVGGGAAFYFAVERPALALRDRMAPAKPIRRAAVVVDLEKRAAG